MLLKDLWLLLPLAVALLLSTKADGSRRFESAKAGSLLEG